MRIRNYHDFLFSISNSFSIICKEKEYKCYACITLTSNFIINGVTEVLTMYVY